MAMEEKEMDLNQWFTSKRYATDMFHDIASVDGDLLYNDDNAKTIVSRMVGN